MRRQHPGRGQLERLELEQRVGVDDGGQSRFAEQTTHERARGPRPRPGPSASADARSAQLATRSSGRLDRFEHERLERSACDPPARRSRRSRRPRGRRLRRRGRARPSFRARRRRRAPSLPCTCSPSRLRGTSCRMSSRDEAVPRLRVLEPDVRDLDLAGVEAPGRDDEPDLPAVHRHRHVRVDGRALDLAGRRVDAGGDVDGDHGRAERVDLLDRRRRIRARVRREARCRAARRSRRRRPRPALRSASSCLCQHAHRDPAVAAVRALAAEARCGRASG